MDNENRLFGSAFTPIDQRTFLQIMKSQILAQVQVSFQKFNKHTHKLLVTNEYIILTGLQINSGQQAPRQVYGAKIQFQLKFQIQSDQQNDPRSQKIGISFYQNIHKKNTFYSLHEPQLRQVRGVLSKRLNQRGFHSLYIPTKKLGKGNFATVYQIERVQDGCRFAVKAYSKESIYAGQNGRQGLINELNMLREASKISVNVISLQQVYQTDNSIYAILQLIEGRSFADVISQKISTGLTYQQCRIFLRGLLCGIRALHSKNIMHRDMKPENILFRTTDLSNPLNYNPVITDFGMATRYDIIPYIFFRCGTPGFVAPQVANLITNKPYSPVCDLFSVGCLFHLALTGQLLFGSDSYAETLDKNRRMQMQMRTERVNKNHPLAMNLLQSFLTIVPQHRINAQNALQHDYFGQLKVFFPKVVEQPRMVEQPKQPIVAESKPKQNIVQPPINPQKQIQQKNLKNLYSNNYNSNQMTILSPMVPYTMPNSQNQSLFQNAQKMFTNSEQTSQNSMNLKGRKKLGFG